MNRVEVYLKAKETLERLAKSQKVDINKYYIPASPETLRKNLAEKGVYITNPSTSIDLPVLFYLFCGHLADRQFMSNTVRFYTKGNYDTQRVLGKVFGNYNPVHVAEFGDVEAIKKAIVEISPNKIQNENRWNEYLTGIHECAKWLLSNQLPNGDFDISVIISMLGTCENKTDIRKMLFDLRPLWYKYQHLTGVGPAVCYNWLKECGAVWLTKPDLHIKRIVAKLLKKEMRFEDYAEIENTEEDLTRIAEKIIDQYLKNNPHETQFPKGTGISGQCKMTKDEFIAVYMWKWAQEIRKYSADNQCSAYKLDRVLYLYCTNGYFYLEGDGDLSEDGLLGMIDE